MTGQEAANVAESFHSALELTGVVLSKMDSDARGGAALSIVHSTGVPIRYISTGEHIKDLEPFTPIAWRDGYWIWGHCFLGGKSRKRKWIKNPRANDQKSGKGSLQRGRPHEANRHDQNLGSIGGFSK